MGSEQLAALYQAGGVLGVVVGGGYFALRWVMSEVAKMTAPGAPRKISTEVYTTDTAAMTRLASSLDALTAAVNETNQMLRNEVREREIKEEVNNRIRDLRQSSP